MEKSLYISNNFCLGSHDYSISIIYDDEVYSIEVDKLLQVKHFGGMNKFFNKERLYRICIDVLIEFIHNDDFLKELKIYNINYLGNNLLFGEESYNYYINNHHYLHACSAYYPSPFEKSAILIVDNLGGLDNDGLESQSMWLGNGINIEKLYSNLSNTPYEVGGIGRAYSIISEFIGLEEGSVMGLSSYGSLEDYNHIRLFSYDGDSVFFDEDTDLCTMYGINKSDIEERESNITKSKFANIAKHLQSETENAMVYLANRLYEKTHCSNLCLAGGVALNILANTKIFENTGFKNIFVQPASNDGGLSLGGSYYGYHILGKNEKRIQLLSPGLGKQYTYSEIQTILDKYSNFLEYSDVPDIEARVAKLLFAGKIVGWFQGKNEFGPRSLGFRSILASPTSVQIRDRVNNIKNRQSWRPLAPVILYEYISDYFSGNIHSPYMTFSANVLPHKITEIPGVVHIDGTSRYQSVKFDENLKYYKLINEFYKISNIPILINTSFNTSGQSIVYFIEDAIEMFLSTDLDYLIIEDFIISKTKIEKSFTFSSIKNSDKLNKLNTLDMQLFQYRWNYLREILFSSESTIGVDYCDGDSIYDFSLEKYCFTIENNFSIVIERKKYGYGYFKVINNLGIRISTNNFISDDRSQIIMNRVVYIISKFYDKLIFLFS